MCLIPFTLSALLTKMVIFANSADQDETVRWVLSGSTQFPILLLIFWLKPLFATMAVSKFRDGRVHFRNSGMKLLIDTYPGQQPPTGSRARSSCPSQQNLKYYTILCWLSIFFRGLDILSQGTQHLWLHICCPAQVPYKKGSTLKGKNLLPGEQILSFHRTPFSALKGAETILIKLPPLKVYPLP